MAEDTLGRMTRLLPREVLQWEAYRVLLGQHPELRLSEAPDPKEVQELATRFFALANTADVAVAAFYGAVQARIEATEGAEEGPAPEPPVIPIDRKPRRA